MGSTRQRKVVLIVLGVVLLLLFLVVAAQNAFKLTFLNPATAGQIFLFTAISIFAFLLFLTALLLLVRNALKLYADQRSRVLGARLRTRMLWGAVLISLLPILCMFGFSYMLMNRAVERWFSQPTLDLRDDSARIALELSRYVTANARAEAASLSSELAGDGDVLAHLPAVDRAMRAHEVTLQGGFVLIYREERAVVRFHAPKGDLASIDLRAWEPQAGLMGSFGSIGSSGSGGPAMGVPGAEAAGADVRGDERRAAQPVRGPLDAIVLKAMRNTDSALVTCGGNDYVVGAAWLGQNTQVAVALPLPAGLSGNLQRLRRDQNQYWTLFRLRRQIRWNYTLLMLMITSLALFCTSWLALHLSKQVTRPVEALADAMNAVAQGNYDRRVDAAATEELGELAAVFNTMAGELDSSRRMVERSTEDVVAANSELERRGRELEMRGRELETMLQTIPNGVVMLDTERRIRVANRAFSEMLDPGGQRSFVGEVLEAVLPGDASEHVDRLLQRSHRMSSASGEMEMQSPGGLLHIAATVALLESSVAGERRTIGYVVVLENATELLRAQKQSAWKEVARRVAHEIKNPLTPISLSAEQIRRHIGRLGGLLEGQGLESASVGTIQRSSEVISASVESMRSLVDQFSSLAEFPGARPRPADLNTIVENTLVLFAGRLQGVRVVRSFAPLLPLVMADPEAMKRALSNLIDNAAEAMSGSLLKEMRIATAMSESAENMVELTVADSGPGVTDEMRERLFLPYFSTKQRGTGLGLTIAAKIVAEHQGAIRVEKNSPSGARFVMDLPVASAVQDESGDQRDGVVAEAAV